MSKGLKTFLHLILLCICLFNYPACTSADNAKKLFKNHFVYIKTGEVNLRSGPSKKYAIKCVIRSKNEPVLSISQFEDWIKVRDIDGDEGWVNKSSVSTTNIGGVVISKTPVAIHTKPKKTSRPIVRLENRVRVTVKKCDDYGWCNISIGKIKGWIPISNLWGLNNSNAN